MHEGYTGPCLIPLLLLVNLQFKNQYCLVKMGPEYSSHSNSRHSSHTHFPGGSVVKNPSARKEMQET